MRKSSLLLTTTLVAVFTSTAAWADGFAKDEYLEFESAELVPYVASDSNAFSKDTTSSSSGVFITKGFEGISQYDVASVARNFIPPDTMGAVGTSQYVAVANGGFAVYDKATGARSLFESDLAFWAAAGQTGANGDTRIMYNASANRWVALAFGGSVSNIQIAVSDTSNALGPWKSTIFTGFAGGTADYPTMAMDTNALYIGTNNFNSAGSFRGTTLNVIPLASIFDGAGPTTVGRGTVNTPYNPSTGGADGGFAIQGVNSTTASSKGTVVSASLFFDDTISYDVNFFGGNPSSVTPVQYLGTAGYDDNGAGRQPNAVPDTGANADFANNDRVIDTLDQRVGSSVYEANGKIYFVYTNTPAGEDYTYVHYVVLDAATKAVLSEGNIGDGAHDYYEGSLAVNAFGEVVIAYNRSGSDPLDGKISVMAQAFTTKANGTLAKLGAEQLLKVSLVDDYHNGSLDGQVAAGRQRWGDYSQVSLDPSDPESFWIIGEYAREYNDPAGGHPGGTGGSRWSEWITQLTLTQSAVPEPASWALMVAGFGMIGASLRQKRKLSLVATIA